MNVFRSIAERVIAPSSMDVYWAYGLIMGTEDGPLQPIPITEEGSLRRKLYPFRGEIEEDYDYEKILVERVVMEEYDLLGTILRLPMVYGPNDPPEKQILNCLTMKLKTLSCPK